MKREFICDATGRVRCSCPYSRTLVVQFANQGPDFTADLVANPAEYTRNFIICSPRFGGILERPVQLTHVARHDRTVLLGVVTDCDHDVGCREHGCIDDGRLLSGNVDSDFRHRHNRPGIESMRLDARGERCKLPVS